MFKTFRPYKKPSCNAQGGVMMKATQPVPRSGSGRFLFKLLIVPFNAPAHFLAVLTNSTSEV